MVISLLRTLNLPPLVRHNFVACDECLLGKSTQSPATSSFHCSPNILNLVHSDILGPISPPTATGKKYILSFIDDHSRYNTIFLLSHKSEASENFKEYQALIELKTGAKVGKLKSDRGGEYSSTSFINYLKSQGIEEEKGPAHQPTANSVSECFIQTLIGRIQSQLIQSGLPLFLWGELAQYCSLQINASSSRAIDFKTPIQLFRSLGKGHIHPVNFNRLKTFGCLSYSHVQNRPTKLEPTDKHLIFVGLEPGGRAARLWDKSSQRIVVSGDVRYREDIFPAKIPSQYSPLPQPLQCADFPPELDSTSSDSSSPSESHPTTEAISVPFEESQDHLNPITDTTTTPTMSSPDEVIASHPLQ